VPEHKVRVLAPDVGGGFGSKIYHYAEEAIVTWASKKIGRPVKWTAERSESFMSDAHGRDHVTHAELALDKNGKFLALKVSTTANMGAYLSLAAVPRAVTAAMITIAIRASIRAYSTAVAPRSLPIRPRNQAKTGAISFISHPLRAVSAKPTPEA